MIGGAEIPSNESPSAIVAGDDVRLRAAVDVRLRAAVQAVVAGKAGPRPDQGIGRVCAVGMGSNSVDAEAGSLPVAGETTSRPISAICSVRYSAIGIPWGTRMIDVCVPSKCFTSAAGAILRHAASTWRR